MLAKIWHVVVCRHVIILFTAYPEISTWINTLHLKSTDRGQRSYTDFCQLKTEQVVSSANWKQMQLFYTPAGLPNVEAIGNLTAPFRFPCAQCTRRLSAA